jgi:hypothetical protein
MDPDTALAEIRELLTKLQPLRDKKMVTAQEQAVLDLMDKFDDLDGWLKLGGYPPTEWNRNDQPTTSVAKPVATD